MENIGFFSENCSSYGLDGQTTNFRPWGKKRWLLQRDHSWKKPAFGFPWKVHDTAEQNNSVALFSLAHFVAQGMAMPV